jgi:hypothetical protein
MDEFGTAFRRVSELSNRKRMDDVEGHLRARRGCDASFNTGNACQVYRQVPNDRCGQRRVCARTGNDEVTAVTR